MQCLVMGRRRSCDFSPAARCGIIRLCRARDATWRRGRRPRLCDPSGGGKQSTCLAPPNKSACGAETCRARNDVAARPTTERRANGSGSRRDGAGRVYGA
jgi:hypothetical protein